jgi:AcrR family transcriptional regulator
LAIPGPDGWDLVDWQRCRSFGNYMAKKFHLKKRPELGYNIKQLRGRKTYDAMIAAGIKLLEKQSYESLTVASLTMQAGYSVGAFYSRFRSKDEYFDSMLQHHIEVRLETTRRILEECPPDTVVDVLLTDLVNYYASHKNFWRATIIRNSSDPGYWQPLRQLGEDNARRFVEYMESKLGRQLDQAERANIMYGFQVCRSVINNTIINNPGPVSLGQQAFIDNLVRAFYLISEYRELLAVPARRPGSAIRQSARRSGKR